MESSICFVPRLFFSAETFLIENFVLNKKIVGILWLRANFSKSIYQAVQKKMKLIIKIENFLSLDLLCFV